MLQAIRIAAARHILGHLSSREVPSLATAALEAGVDTPELRILAGQTDEPWSQIETRFHAVLNELGIPEMTRNEAGLVLARDFARRIVAGDIPVGSGGEAIAQLCSELNFPPELVPFVAILSERDDFQTCRTQDPARYDRLIAECDTQIVELARSLAVAA